MRKYDHRYTPIPRISPFSEKHRVPSLKCIGSTGQYLPLSHQSLFPFSEKHGVPSLNCIGFTRLLRPLSHQSSFPLSEKHGVPSLKFIGCTGLYLPSSISCTAVACAPPSVYWYLCRISPKPLPNTVFAQPLLSIGPCVVPVHSLLPIPLTVLEGGYGLVRHKDQWTEGVVHATVVQLQNRETGPMVWHSISIPAAPTVGGD